MERTEGFDQLLGALVGMVRTSDRVSPDEETYHLAEMGLEKLFSHVSEEEREYAAEQIRQKKAEIMPDCVVCRNPCGRFSDYDCTELWNGEEGVRSAKLAILEQLKEMGEQGRSFRQDAVFRALFALGEDCERDWLLSIADQLKI